MDLKQKLGAKIRYLRKSRKYSQEYFSELIDLNPRQIVRIENGESMPTVENLEKIAKVFDIDVAELFINDSFDKDDILRQKIHEKINEFDRDKLRTMYLITMNL